MFFFPFIVRFAVRERRLATAIMSKTESQRVVDYDVDDVFQDSDVPAKYQGTAADRRDMSMLGKKQVLRRQFKFATMLGFASTVMVAWEFVLLVSPFGLADGGTPAVFWGLLLSPVVMIPVYASLAEVASMSPTAGGMKRLPGKIGRNIKVANP